MKIKINDKDAYYTSSGREIDKKQPTIVFVHGSGLTHVTWVLQTRYFAFHGYNTIAVDLPGHGDSEGPALKTIEEMADWIADLITSLGIEKTSYVGHSQGCLVGLEFAQRHPDVFEQILNQLNILVNDRHKRSSRFLKKLSNQQSNRPFPQLFLKQDLRSHHDQVNQQLSYCIHEKQNTVFGEPK